MDRLLEMLGGFFDWVWSRHLRQYLWCLLYWPFVEKYFYHWILSRKPIIILAGYMSRNRGLHWDRKKI